MCMSKECQIVIKKQAKQKVPFLTQSPVLQFLLPEGTTVIKLYFMCVHACLCFYTQGNILCTRKYTQMHGLLILLCTQIKKFCEHYSICCFRASS